MGEFSTKEVLRVPAILAAVMLALGIIVASSAAVDWTGLVLPYVLSAFAATGTSILILTLITVARLAPQRADKPLSIVFEQVRPRLPLLVLPAIIFPLFLVGFTATKCSIPFLVGYDWDAYWASSDRLLFGDDAWRISHRLIGTRTMPVWEWFYTFGWGAVFFYAKALVPLYAQPRKIAVFFTAMLGTWIIGGWLMAYLFSAAGPVFAHLADPAMANSFDELRAILSGSLTAGGAVEGTQAYLSSAIDSHVAVKGGGVSAMPSMHLGAASIYVLASKGTRFFVPALLFWVLIFFLSAYFGYHYWIDGIVAALVAAVCWRAASAYYAVRPVRAEQLIASPAA
jgi:hypothetical protein